MRLVKCYLDCTILSVFWWVMKTHVRTLTWSTVHTRALYNIHLVTFGQAIFTCIIVEHYFSVLLTLKIKCIFFYGGSGCTRNCTCAYSDFVGLLQNWSVRESYQWIELLQVFHFCCCHTTDRINKDPLKNPWNWMNQW